MSLVRVRVDGQEFNTGAANAANQKWEVLDEPTHGSDGRPLPLTRRNGRPVKPRTTPAAEAAKKKTADQPSATTKED